MKTKRKKPSIWSCLSQDAQEFLILLILIGFSILGIFFPKPTVIGLLVAATAIAIISVGHIIYVAIRSAVIIRNLPVSKEALEENHITTKLEYLQALYRAFKPFSCDYWQDCFQTDYPAKYVQELVSNSKLFHTYGSIKDKNVYTISKDKLEEPNEWANFILWLIAYGVERDTTRKAYKNKNTIVLTDKMLKEKK